LILSELNSRTIGQSEFVCNETVHDTNTTVLMRPHEAKVIENYGGLSERDSTIVGIRFKHNWTCSKHNWK